MSLFSYSIFNSVAEQKSFLKAAEVLNLTPSAISHSITKLENQLGVALFIRDRTGMQLTFEGQNLLPYVRAVLNCEERLKQEAAHINGLEKGVVRIGTYSSICINWIPDIVKSFRQLFPHIQIIIFQGGYEDVTGWIKTGAVDLGFISLPAEENLAVTPLSKDPLLCVTPKDFRPEHPDYVTVDEIKDMSFILQRDDYNKDTKALLLKYNLSVHSQFYSIDDQSIVAMVESGLGIAILPELVLQKNHSDVGIYRFKPDEHRLIGLAYLKKQYLSPAALKIFDHILAYVEKEGLNKL
ncbi:LysR family transcriptional regulator [Sporolactobacillus laevolacticus]|uniref:LysR family transcriptional regulator n=1 Tax=Sporolactobacillus laevolacticus TaxID=33018 RepID=UPI0025B524F8|nr:LysR family transcriptional regulator [Sporolactobacillus laevolacticus]MDN3954609.1 LysR family transcriptional regulator [Sporolactobacillus laevolacticus]